MVNMATDTPILCYKLALSGCSALMVSQALVDSAREDSDYDQHWVELYDEHDLRNHHSFVGNELQIWLAPHWFTDSMVAYMASGCYVDNVSNRFLGISNGSIESFCVFCKCKLMINSNWGVICVKCYKEKCSSEKITEKSQGDIIQKFRPGVGPIIVVNPDYTKYVLCPYNHKNIKG